MLAYIMNNIDFRIVSAEAISRFKSVQSHSFLQIYRQELDIDPKTREILLLSYDRFSSWILKVERNFLGLENHRITNEFCTELVSSIREEFNNIEQICTANPDIFNKSLVSFFQTIHECSIRVLSNQIDKLASCHIEQAFSDLIKLISDYLQQVLVATHEFDNNCVKQRQPLFLGFTDICALAIEKNRCPPIMSRAQFFKENCGVNTFLIKNYTEKILAQEFIDELKSIGVEAFLDRRKT